MSGFGSGGQESINWWLRIFENPDSLTLSLLPVIESPPSLLLQGNTKYGLVGLEDHAVVNLHVFVYVEPGAIGRRLAAAPIVQHPPVLALGLVEEAHVALRLRE